jgi:hypothetical protein
VECTKEEGEHMAYSMRTLRWAAPSILVGGVLYAAYGVFNRLLAATLMGYFLGNFLGATLLAVSVADLQRYLRERGVPLGRVGQGGLGACVVALAIWATLGLTAILSLALFGASSPHILLFRVSSIFDGVPVLLFVGSVLLGAVLFLRALLVPRGAALLLALASVIALVAAVEGYLIDIPIWVYELLRVLYGAAWAWVGYALWAARGATASQARVR